MVALTIPGFATVGLQTRRVYHSLPHAQAFFSAFRCSAPNANQWLSGTSTQALTCFSILSNIRSFPGGSSVMVRTSRCFVRISFQLGGPDTLRGVERFRRNLPFADFSVAHFQLSFAAIFFVACFHPEGACKFVSQPHIQEGEGAARLVAACR